VFEDVGKLGPSLIAGRNMKGKVAFKMLNVICLTYDPVVRFLSSQVNKNIYLHKNGYANAHGNTIQSCQKVEITQVPINR
jgi:hypothetical protein